LPPTQKKFLRLLNLHSCLFPPVRATREEGTEGVDQ
jgi:hypothetical protein